MASNVSSYSLAKQLFDLWPIRMVKKNEKRKSLLGQFLAILKCNLSNKRNTTLMKPQNYIAEITKVTSVDSVGHLMCVHICVGMYVCGGRGGGEPII